MSKFLEFMTSLVNNDATSVLINRQPERIGYVILNKEWNVKVFFFTDADQCFYLGVNIIEGENKAQTNKFFPLYQLENENEVKGIFDLLINKFDTTKRKEHQPYIQIFRDYFKGADVPQRYNIVKKNENLTLVDKKTDLSYSIPLSHIVNLKKGKEDHLPTQDIGPNFILILTDTENNKTAIYFPKKLIHEYSKLSTKDNVAIKIATYELSHTDYQNLSYTFDEWLNNIKRIDNIDKSSILSLINYLDFKEQILPNQLDNKELINQNKKNKI